MTRTLFFQNDFIQKYIDFNGYTLTAVDIITGENIFFRLSYDKFRKFKYSEKDSFILTGRPWKKCNIGTRRNSNYQLVYGNIKNAGIARRTEVKKTFPEYFI